jgi:tetratricopeptide (TPR) repeat protein
MDRFDWLEVDKPQPGTAPEKKEEFDARHYFVLAEQARRCGRYEAALRDYGKALGEQTDLWEAWFGQVLCLFELGELNEAKLWSGKALDRFPQSAELLAARGLVLAGLGENDDAMALSDRAIAKKDAGFRVWLLRGLSLLRLDPKNRHDGCFVKALEEGPRDGDVELRIGAGYLQQGDAPAAKDYLLHAAEVDSQNPLAWAKLGECFEQIYAHDRARECYERALDLRPESDQRLLDAVARLNSRGVWDRLRGFLRSLGGPS